MEWWSTAKYKIPSTKSQYFRCQVSGFSKKKHKGKNWNLKPPVVLKAENSSEIAYPDRTSATYLTLANLLLAIFA
jgi:hypothetical protein